MSRFVVVVFVCCSGFAGVARAQIAVAPLAVPAPVVFDMDEDVIEAAPARPATVSVVAGPAKKPHKSLIRLRADFRAAVLGSVNAL